jgi:CO/xanthine dehydrogenase Mo-binding subunit
MARKEPRFRSEKTSLHGDVPCSAAARAVARGVEPPPKPSNISKRVEYQLGDLVAGFASADEIMEMSFKTAPVHQAYIEPQVAWPAATPTGRANSGRRAKGTSWSAPTLRSFSA